MKVKCKECGYEWEVKGNLKECPICKIKNLRDKEFSWDSSSVCGCG